MITNGAAHSGDKKTDDKPEGAGALLRRAFPLVLSNGLLFLLRIMTTVILVRIFTQTEFGLYRQYYLLFDASIMLFSMGLSGSALYFIPRLSKEKTKSFLSHTLMISSIAGIVSSMVILSAQKLIAIYFSVEISKHLFGLAGFACFMTGSYFLENLLIAEKRTLFSAVFSVLHYVLIAFSAIAIAYLTRNASKVFYGLAILAFCKYLLVVIYSVARYGFTMTIDRSLVKTQLAYCMPLVIAMLCQVSAISIDKYIVSVGYGSTIFALYVVGALYLPISELVSSPVSLVALPVMARLEKEKNHHDIATLYR